MVSINFLNKINDEELIENAYKTYWVDTGNNFISIGKIFKRNEDLKDKLMKIIKGEDVSIEFIKSFSNANFIELKKTCF